MREVDPSDHSYILVTTVCLTCDRMLSGEQSVPKSVLLINILGVIFRDGSHAPRRRCGKC